MKNLSFVLIMLVSCSLFAQTAEQPSGSGTSDAPYKIANLNNLYWLSQNSAEWDKVYEQTVDIDASATSTWNSGKGFSPIGDDDVQFTGSYDGDEFSIANITIAASLTVTYVGFLGYTDGATLSNITITDIDVSGDGDIGALAGRCTNSTITNCHSSGQITSNRSAGGLIGYSSGESTITNSSSSCNVSGSYRTGGLIGRTYSIVVKNCFSSGNVDGEQECGGFIGDLYDTEIYNCYSLGGITRKSGSTDVKFGGFLGISHNSDIENCYSTGKVIYKDTDNPTDKGFLGYNQGSNTYNNNFWDTETSEQSSTIYGSATGKTTSEMKSIETFTDESTDGLTTAWDFEYNPNDDSANENYWDIDNKNQTINSGFPFLSWENGTDISMDLNLSGSGTADDPYLISDINELKWLSMNSDYWDKVYKQTEDIDASETSIWNSGEGFSPIGDADIEFTGSYDGQNFTIDGIYINRPDNENDTGLFGQCRYASFKYMKLTNVDIEGNKYVGGLIGSGIHLDVTYCQVSGKIKSNSYCIGGLVGCTGSSNITSSISNCDIIGGSEQVGGVIGQVNNSEIEKCSSTGDINGFGYVGGLIGYLIDNSHVYNSKSNCIVSGSSGVGGLIGKISESSVQNCYSKSNVIRKEDYTSVRIAGFCGDSYEGTIENCYATGSVTYEGSSDPTDKGFLGGSNDDDFENNFWDMETSGHTSNSAGGATGKTTAEMKNLATFTDQALDGLTTAWDFEENPYDDLSDENYWDLDNKNGSINSGYPFLSWENGETVSLDIAPSGSGTSENPYLITQLDDLRWLSNNSKAWDKHYQQTSDIDASETSIWNSGKGFSPIGNNDVQFTGSYDGQNYKIDDLAINRSDEDYTGLFGKASNATIGNLFLANVNIKGYASSGGFAGEVTSSTITNCRTSGVVFSDKDDAYSDNIGGLIGSISYSEISSSSSSCNVTGNNSVGGLIGDCSDESTIKKCYSSGSAFGLSWVGGCIGYISVDNSISMCYSSASAEGNDYIGGFIGSVSGKTTIENCYCKGSITRSSGSTGNRIGGFCGDNYDGTIENCYTIGSVIYEDSENPTNKGFLGSGDNNDLKNNFWDTETSGQSSNSEGGATGKTTDEMKTLATFTDETTSGLITAWDFETNPNDDEANKNYWDMDRSGVISDGYPFLAWENGDGENDVSLSVDLSSFTATVKGNSVLLKWTTASEMNNMGFNIYRSVSDDDNFIQINRSLIEGAINSSSTKTYEFTDAEIIPGYTYNYQLEDINTDGESELHDIISIQVEQNENQAADTYSLSGAYPNPFNPTTNIRYSLPEDTFVNIIIYDSRGKVVNTIVNENQSSGYYDVIWDASGLSSGIYFYRITAGGFSEVKKCLLLK